MHLVSDGAWLPCHSSRELAWYTAPTGLEVVDTQDALRELAAPAERAGVAPVVAWWIADRHDPTVSEAAGRLEFLHRHGVSPYAFTPLERQPHLSIERVWLDDVDVQLLISQLNLDLYSRYPEPGALVYSLGWPTSSKGPARC